MRRTIVAGARLACTLFGFGACGGQVVIGGAEPLDSGSLEAGEQPLGEGSTTEAADAGSPAVNGDAGGGAANQPAATIHADVYPIAPGQEAILCQTFSNPFGRDVDLVSIEATAEFAHDVFLFSLPPDGGLSRAPTALMGCLLDPLGLQPFLYFSDQPQFAMTYPQPDMGYPLAATNSLMLRAHYLNAGATMGPAQTTLSLTAAMPGQVTTHVGAIFLSHSGFPVDSLDDGGPLTEETAAIPLGQAFNIFTSWNFAQPLKARVTMSANGTVFYDVTNAGTYSQLSEHSPPVSFGAAESITWSCTYPLEDLAMNGKCVYQAFYYPADPHNPDRAVSLYY
jgi:hypothetical protein